MPPTGYVCTKQVIRNGMRGRCSATPARWTGKSYRCRRHESA